MTWEALSLAAVLGTAVAAGLHFGADAALQVMGAAPDTGALHDKAQEYLQVRALAAPAVLLSTVGQGAFRQGLGSEHDTDCALLCSTSVWTQAYLCVERGSMHIRRQCKGIHSWGCNSVPRIRHTDSMHSVMQSCSHDRVHAKYLCHKWLV